MRFMEMIRLQSSELQNESKHNELMRLIKKELKTADCLDYQILTREDRSGEIMLTIYWNQEPVDSESSQISQVLGRELGDYGLVSCSIWSENATDKNI